MIIYKKVPHTTAIVRVNQDSFTSFLFDPANTDYANFKRDVEDGVELQDADGAVMSANTAKEFVAKLP